jgi:hypothetical protein
LYPTGGIVDALTRLMSLAVIFPSTKPIGAVNIHRSIGVLIGLVKGGGYGVISLTQVNDETFHMGPGVAGKLILFDKKEYNIKYYGKGPNVTFTFRI